MKIACSGKMGTGKDEASKYLSNKYGGVVISFAEPLYDILKYAQTVAGFPIEKDRKFLQFVGTDWARTIDENVWINKAIEKAPENGNAFISDLRFINEFEALKENGWICIKLLRNVESQARAGTGSTSHISENSLDNVPNHNWDHIIENNGTLEEFYTKLDSIISS